MNTLGIDPVKRLQRVRASLQQALRFANVVLPLTKYDARLVLKMLDNELAKADTDAVKD